MQYIAIDFLKNEDAPVGKWVCTRTSDLGPYDNLPPVTDRHSPDFCGQCVSYATTVCPNLPVNTGEWVKGDPVRDNKNINLGQVIATFDLDGNYSGHTAIYVSQDKNGIHVYDQWCTGHGKSIGPRLIKWKGVGVSNHGESFCVVVDQ